VKARDYSLAEAARPAFGNAGVAFTAGVAILATSSGLIASIFAVSRMLAMLTEMELMPHRHFGMPGDMQRHTLVYTVAAAGLLAVFFDLSRIASLGIIFYLVMDLVVHWGVLRNLREEVGAKIWVLIGAIALDSLVLGTFLVIKGLNDPMIIGVAAAGIALIVAFERLYLNHARVT